MTTISDGGTTVTPILVTGWDTERTARNVLHDIISREDVDVTYRPAGLRAGTLEALLPTLEEALVLEALLAQAKSFTLADTDHPLLDMTFVASGKIGVTLDDETRIQATVAFDFQQVAT